MPARRSSKATRGGLSIPPILKKIVKGAVRGAIAELGGAGVRLPGGRGIALAGGAKRKRVVKRKNPVLY